ncbi:MAG: adenylate kinase [Melioribacteraceae bacterium]
MKMLIFFGAPGVGKGTQAKIISSKLNIPHISTGDILREAICKKNKLGLEAKKFTDKGELVPGEIMVELVENVLRDEKCRNGFILDGFPRTLQQAEILQPIIEKITDEKIIIISLEADDEIIINRLAQRRTCKVCNGIVNLNILNDHSTCPICGSKNSFIKRKDDEVEVIKNRLHIFHSATSPVLDFFEKHDFVFKIDATLSVEEIANKIMEVIN